jgi:hypothetical protein
MMVRQSRSVLVLLTLLCSACGHSFTRQDALAAIEHHETLHRLLTPDTARVAHETLADCRAIYSDDPVIAEMAGDSAWILLSSAGWMDLADVDAPSDPRQKKHCRAVLTSKADKAAFREAQDAGKSPWPSSWVVETAHAKTDVFEIPADSVGRNSAVADFQIIHERTTVGEVLHRPTLAEDEARPFTAILTGRFRYHDGGWQLESFEEKK